MKKTKWQIFINGVFKENPVLILLLGCCSVLAISVTVKGALGMGVALTFVLVGSNIVISLLRKVIPDKVRIPCFIVVIATFVTLVEMVVEAFLPDLYDALGIFLALIVVNCIVLGRAEGFANKHGVVESALDGIGVGLGFTLSLTVIGLVREILGSGSAFGWKFIPGDGILAFVMAPGAFIVLGFLMVLFNKYLAKK